MLNSLRYAPMQKHGSQPTVHADIIVFVNLKEAVIIYCHSSKARTFRRTNVIESAGGHNP